LLGELLPHVGGEPVNKQGTVMSLLESLKNSLIGKVHMPHSPLIDHGIHALTFEGIFSSATQKAAAKSSS
jgi:hypothetical protein